ncbi:putative Zn-binding protein involved in type VI secretion [Dokdonella fugitiva]|uniref:Putative Zn-binding protein involved in type VI secretion n=1 Tax=Dokdonella fugitiva TaxID=328517 RepID=A0A839EVB7_9GAMM|nr:peptide-N4-asparagine amidase [Dokdonella fugitiva]MBA8887685.1 putative Zn-binding protein involved in type VI secretion [Dokdonella fugitiva]
MSYCNGTPRGLRGLKALLASSLSLFALAAAADPPTVGSPNVAVADPVVPRPPGTPCTVSLYQDQAFADFDAKPFTYAPPADCPGPWQKVVLDLDYSVTAGRQFDRTATIWLGGAILYFGTTQEPSATVAPSWHVERDLTDYAPLFSAAHAGRAILGNFVGNSGGVDYTGIIHGNASLVFYPTVASVPDHPPRPDLLLPLAGSADGSTADLASSSDALAITFDALPTNIERAFLDVYAQSQGTDEFWYFNLPDDVAGTFADYGNTAFREGEVAIDDIPAGVVPIFPWIFTGGADPLLWRPIPGVQTLAFEPYRVDLTPFAATLSDGAPHTVSLRVFNAIDHFSTAANLMLYLDHGATHVTGAVTTNTLTADPSPSVGEDVVDDDAGSHGTVTVTSNRTFTIAGTLATSHGPVTTEVRQAIAFSSVQQLATNADFYPYKQDTVQTTTIDSTTTRTDGAATSVVHEQRSYPLTFTYEDGPGADGNEVLASHVDQALQQQVDVGYDGYVARGAQRTNHVVTSARRLYDDAGNNTDLQADATQSYTYRDPFGACWSRTLTASRRGLTLPGALTAVDDGADCSASTLPLSWFDIYYNYASSVTGATLQLLP